MASSAVAGEHKSIFTLVEGVWGVAFWSLAAGVYVGISISLGVPRFYHSHCSLLLLLRWAALPLLIMPHPSKKQRLTVTETDIAEATVTDQMMVATAGDLSIDVLANILGYLDVQDIMNARVCKKWKKAATTTIVPPTDFRVNSMRKYNAMNVMTEAMPNLQQITLLDLGRGNNTSMGRIQLKGRLLRLPTGQRTISK